MVVNGFLVQSNNAIKTVLMRINGLISKTNLEKIMSASYSGHVILGDKNFKTFSFQYFF
ncbi:hypothetical protein SDC9_157543 [bioreactor metagenome]|uniref:Uncharacterized protein n=1 Tax=bioreactor metagenome TaxID=1076179 RepID=A0A645F798_9ZZZZ